MAKFGAIFISYRRSDSINEAGRIYDKLKGIFGDDHVFKDVDDIPYGADFVTHLDKAVAGCDVFIPLIGKNWLNVTDAQGHRRLDDPNDFVRIEIASALNRDILVLPILLSGATMPSASQLPENLQSLARRNAARVRYDPDFHRDMERIIKSLEKYFVSRGLAVISKEEVTNTTVQHSKQPRPNALHIAAATISGINGLIGLIEWLTFWEPPILLATAALFTSAAALLQGLKWGWKCATATQVFILILCIWTVAFDFVPPFFISPFIDFLLIIAVALSSCLALILLMLSRPQRRLQGTNRAENL
ncbi:MAG: toll/interleukin-1 receptor domain-containing protein [Cyanobacteria bacterium P01_F01_bin.3]